MARNKMTADDAKKRTRPSSKKRQETHRPVNAYLDKAMIKQLDLIGIKLSDQNPRVSRSDMLAAAVDLAMQEDHRAAFEAAILRKAAEKQ